MSYKSEQFFQGYVKTSSNCFTVKLLNSAVKPLHVLFENEPFLRKMLVLFFSSNIPLYIVENPVEKLCKFLEMKLQTYTPVGLKFVFGKSDLKFCIIFNMISFANAQGSVKIRLACSKALLLNISSSNIVTHSKGYKKGDKYFFF